MQDFHDEVGLAERRAAGHGRSDARCDAGIEEIDVEADMQQAIRCSDPVEKAREQRSYAVLVDTAHVMHGDAGLPSARRSSGSTLRMPIMQMLEAATGT